MDDNDFLNLIDTISKRPALYIGKNSISVLRGFIDGWSFARKTNNWSGSILSEFEKWIQDLYKMDDRCTWDRIILCFSQDEEKALTGFFKLFKTFLEERE